MTQKKTYFTDLQDQKWSRQETVHHHMDMTKTRLVMLGVVFILAFVVISFRLFDLCILRHSGASSLASESNSRSKVLVRGDIVDRNGEVLVTSLRTYSLYANAKVVLDPQEAAAKLLTVLPELNYKDVLTRLQSDKGFVWIARHLTPTKQAEVLRLGIPGIYFQKDERRVYPHGALAAHVMGFTDIDNRGISGIEKQYNELLISGEEKLQLSLDLRVQHILRDELMAGIAKFKAVGASGIVMNVKTGEILAMVSLPDFDPNQVKKIGANEDVLFNRNTLGIYEMGSSFKIINTAMLLESGLGNLYSQYDVTGPYRLGRFKITDTHPHVGAYKVADIFIHSSNIGSIKMALQVGQERQKNFFKSLGFFQPSPLELPEVGSPMYPKNWSEATLITASYGYGVAVSPLQLITAVAGIINNGMMKKPTLLKVNDATTHESVRVVSSETSDAMKKLLYMQVSIGTGGKAKVAGFEVGGKTGTANTLEGRSYKQKSNRATFLSAFPMSDPQYALIIILEKPQAVEGTYGFNMAGWNAAPVTANVIRRMAAVLKVMPTSRIEFEKLPNASMLIDASYMPQGQ
ncbi:Cell division protein FtsI/penicillin-binding protein 2 [Candidatus Bealeia paramacronuclearis]|uniref:Cell division protein FtsI/penicillin-binding protein 2 n=1 Tax=Candidatus Bealeia paramacronuclearis TaxID=1921001 RepID=A0ABZ2C2A8_9PROT|nr:Cell division protein FtsI/penicillin-binding protein 2 [Candidatus Bealeia paramacronuclearis]